MKEYILYQAYGSMDIINECKYSLLRMLDVYAGKVMPQIIIYTDSKDKFELFQDRLNIIFKTISSETISQWEGEINFVHRIKIEVIKDALESYEGKIIYCDTDTYCLAPLDTIYDSITNQNVFFHLREGVIDSDFAKWKKFLITNELNDLSNKSESLQTQMWNAGVIGLRNAHLPIVEEALKLTDKIYPLFSKHTVEQFAFCYTFQKHGIKISASDSYIFHYWNLKEFRILLNSFFATNQGLPIDELVIAGRNILPQRIVPEKLKFNSHGFLRKLLLKLSGKGWSIKKHYS